VAGEDEPASAEAARMAAIWRCTDVKASRGTESPVAVSHKYEYL
jgi:hypothetical protein